MAVWDSVVDRFKGTRSLEKVGVEDLRKERINLDQKEKEYIQQIQRLEREQKELLEQGIKEPSQHMKVVYARKVAEKDSEVKMNQKVLQSLAHQMRIVNGLMMVKRWSQVTAKDKTSVLNRLSIADLSKWIHDKTVDGEFKDQYIEELGGVLESGMGVITEVGKGEDQNTQKVLEIMNKAGSEGLPAEKAAEKAQSEVKTVLSSDKE